MNQLPDVTVVIATRDRPELLRRALQAVADQAYAGPVDCVVVFDQAPIDRTLAARFPAGQGIRALRLVANRRTPGLAGARNTGIESACGELVAFCDDDDFWKPAKLDRQVAALTRARAAAGDGPRADVVVTGIEVHYADPALAPGQARIVARVPRASDVTLAELARRRVMEAHPSTVLVRRTALVGPDATIGLVDEAIPGSYGEDYDWMLRAAQAGPIAVVEEPLVEVTWAARSYFQERWQTIIESIDYGLAKHAVLASDPVGHARLLGRKAFAYAALGQRRTALRWAARAWRRNWREPRAYVCLVVGLGFVSADRALRLAHRRGRGI